MYNTEPTLYNDTRNGYCRAQPHHRCACAQHTPAAPLFSAADLPRRANQRPAGAPAHGDHGGAGHSPDRNRNPNPNPNPNPKPNPNPNPNPNPITLTLTLTSRGATVFSCAECDFDKYEACAHGGAGVQVRFKFSRAASPQPMEEEAVQGEPTAAVVVELVKAASEAAVEAAAVEGRAPEEEAGGDAAPSGVGALGHGRRRPRWPTGPSARQPVSCTGCLQA